MADCMDGYYFQRISLCETLSRTVAVYTKGFVVFFQLAFVFTGIYSIVWAILSFMLMPAFHLDATQLKDPNYLVAHIGSFYALEALDMLVAVLIGAIGIGAYVRAVGDIYLQREVNFSTCIQVGIHHAGSILTASFLGFVGIALGLICLYIPGIYFMVRWFLFNPVIVVEGLGAVEAMKRSWALVSGSWCYVFCTYMISVSFFLVLNFSWQLVLGVNVHTSMGIILRSIPTTIAAPIMSVMMSVMYINLRVEKEGLNAELFSRNLRESDGTRYGKTNYSTLVDKDDPDQEETSTSSIV